MLKKFVGIIFIVTLVTSLFVGCGKDDNNEQSNNSNTQGSSNSEEKNEEKVDEKERVKIVINIQNLLNDQGMLDSLDEIQTMEKFSHVDFEILDKDPEYLTTMPIAVASGQQMDIVAVFNPIEQAKYAKNGVIKPIDEYIENAGVDYAKEFGNYVPNTKNDGKTFLIPHQVTQWVLYYNKKIFDDANIPYPDQDVPMTWDEYRQLAADLTSGEGDEKIYGALHVEWPMFWYGEAIMKLGGGEKFYTEDGLSNIEDPAFKDALMATYDMMHVDKSIPTHADIVISKTEVMAFMNGKYGMIPQGSWLLSWAADRETYPRDWELGIAPLPVDEGTQWKSWGVVNGLAVAETSADPQLAFEIALELSRLNAKHTLASPEANQTVPQEKLFVGIGEQLGETDGLTSDVLLKMFNNPDLIFLTEKVTGPNNTEYEQVINEEVEKYFVQEQDIDTTIKNIKERGDKVIQKN